MDRDAASQPTEHDKEFIRIYKLIHLANEKALFSASEELNSRLSEASTKRYIRELVTNFEKISKILKKYRDNIATVDPNVVLNDRTTYPTYVDLLSSENKRKLGLFEKSIDDFEKSDKMIRELNKLIKSPSSRTIRPSTRGRVGGRRKKRQTRNNRNHCYNT